MVRAAAKNYKDVTVITSQINMKNLINELKINKGSTSLEFREKCLEWHLLKLLIMTAVISNYFNKIKKTNFPKKKFFMEILIETLRYGENPHQKVQFILKIKS